MGNRNPCEKIPQGFCCGKRERRGLCHRRSLEGDHISGAEQIYIYTPLLKLFHTLLCFEIDGKGQRMNHDIADIHSLDNLLHSLYTILKNENNPETRYAEQIIGRMGNNIGIALSDEQANVCELFSILKSDYKSLFPPRDGLTDFYIRRDDLSLQCKLNSDYKNTLSQIHTILDRH